ncbi:MAG: putative NreB protein [Devosia sp.]|nr:putative NreB protein [Devosia sp.]
MSYRALLQSPAQRRLLLAGIPADFSDWLDYVAVVALLVYTWQQGPFILALFAVALTLPYVIAGPLLATLIDRSDLRRVLIISNLGRAAATLVFIVAPNPFVVLALVFVRGVIDSAFSPARQSTIQLITPPDQLMAANGAHQGINQLSKIAGPAAGGVLLALLPIGSVFAIDALLSLLAAMILLGIKLPQRPVSTAKSSDAWTELSAGFREFLGNRTMLFALIIAAFAYFAFFIYDTLIALLAVDFGLGTTIFGLSIAASGAGGVIGSLVGGVLPAGRPFVLMSPGALVSAPVAILLGAAALAGWPVPALVFLVAMATAGGATAFMLLPYRTIIQRETPPDRIARVFAAGEAVTMAVMLSAPFLGSLIATGFGTGAAFIVGGVLLLGLGVVSLTIGLRR